MGLLNPTTVMNTQAQFVGANSKSRLSRLWCQITRVGGDHKIINIGTARIAQMIGTEEQQKFLTNLGMTDPIKFEMIEAKGQTAIAQMVRTLHYDYFLWSRIVGNADAFGCWLCGDCQWRPAIPAVC